VRSTDEEKESQLSRLLNFKERHAQRRESASIALKRRVIAGDNIFAALIESSETMTLGEITRTLYEVGGQYRRNM